MSEDVCLLCRLSEIYAGGFEGFCKKKGKIIKEKHSCKKEFKKRYRRVKFNDHIQRK